MTTLARRAVGGLDALAERAAEAHSLARALGWPLLAVLLALGLTALLILAAGKNPLLAYAALARGALGSWDRVGVGLNKATPYVLTGVGVALCFRARVINIGGEGQIALGGLAATWMALTVPEAPALARPLMALAAGAVAGAAWAALAAAIRLYRNVHEVLVTLLMNFVGVLIVSEALQGPLGEPGAGFPQSPLLARAAWLPRLPGSDLHAGILVAVAVVVVGRALLWRAPFGFRLRVLGASVPAATYAGISAPRTLLTVMSLAGALAGLAGGIEVLGVHYRLIEGFSAGFGFNAVAIALLGGLNPIAVLPAGLFFGFLETGALAMQRAVGVPSSLVSVIQGLTMVFILSAMGLAVRRARA